MNDPYRDAFHKDIEETLKGSLKSIIKSLSNEDRKYVLRKETLCEGRNYDYPILPSIREVDSVRQDNDRGETGTPRVSPPL